MKKIKNSQSKLISYLVKKGAEAFVLDGTEVVYVKAGNNKFIFMRGYSPLVPQNIGLLLSNKYYTNSLLKNEKIKVPKISLTNLNSENQVLKIISKMKYPVIFSDNSSQSLVKSELADTDKKAKKIINFFKDEVLEVLIQKPADGEDYRIFYSQSGYFQVLKESYSLDLYTGKPLVYRENVTKVANKKLKKLAKKVLKTFQPMFYVSFRLKAPKNISKDGRMTVLEVYHSASPHYGKYSYKGKIKKDVVQVLGDHLLG